MHCVQGRQQTRTVLLLLVLVIIAAIAAQQARQAGHARGSYCSAAVQASRLAAEAAEPVQGWVCWKTRWPQCAWERSAALALGCLADRTDAAADLVARKNALGSVCASGTVGLVGS